MTDLKATMSKLDKLFSKTRMDWTLSVHHCLTEPTCPTVVIEPEDMHTARYRIDADSIEQGIAEAVERVYREVMLGQIIEPLAPFTNPNDKCLESLLAAWARGEKPEPPEPEPNYREVERHRLRRRYAALRAELADAKAEIDRLRSVNAQLLEDVGLLNDSNHRLFNKVERARREALEEAATPENKCGAPPCDQPENCRRDGECHYTKSPFRGPPSP